MKFFIVTPCRNSAHLLGPTIESILNQTAVRDGRVELEYWIQDGASTDSTRSIVESYSDDRIHFQSAPDGGMYEALAAGLEKANGNVIAYLNAGDIYFSHAFEILAEVFSNPEVDWTTAYACLINEASQVTAAWKPPRYRREFVLNGTYLRGHPISGIQQESTFWSARANATIDLTQLMKCRLAGDYFIWKELARQFELHSIMSLLGAFRQHAGQLSEQMEAYLQEGRGMTRPAKRKENLTAYWEYRCNPWVQCYLWKWILPRSSAKLFEYSATSNRWLPR